MVDNITDIDPGHQCYSIDRLEGIPAGTNATIQLEYWSEYEGENNGRNQSFFACADIVSPTWRDVDLGAMDTDILEDFRRNNRFLNQSTLLQRHKRRLQLTLTQRERLRHHAVQHQCLSISVRHSRSVFEWWRAVHRSKGWHCCWCNCWRSCAFRCYWVLLVEEGQKCRSTE